MRRYILLIIIILTALSSCIVSNPKYFLEIQPTKDSLYGYTAQNPVKIKNGDLQYSINSSYYFISKLRTTDGSKLELIGRQSIMNPNKKPAIQMVNRYTGQPINGNAMLLDEYVLIPENGNDTIKIYINPYEKDIINIPAGLQFVKEW